MQRVIIMGPPGSGKSTLARRIGTQHGLPVFHLDRAYWQPGWTMTPAADFTVIYLDVPAWVSVLRIARRTLANHGTVRPDGAPGCAERVDLAFLRFAWTWNRMRREQTLAAIRGVSGRLAIVRGKVGRGDPLSG